MILQGNAAATTKETRSTLIHPLLYFTPPSFLAHPLLSPPLRRREGGLLLKKELPTCGFPWSPAVVLGRWYRGGGRSRRSSSSGSSSSFSFAVD